MERIVVQRHFSIANIQKLKRVAAYARVSSGKDAMLHSLSAQVSYYSDLIQNHSGWQYAGVYADEALTGTKDNREDFQRLLTDCRAGKVDMVITKSISRFARNTVTLLETVRELKTMGVDVFFEEQNIMAISVPHVVGGTYIVETVFSYPGIGALSYESARFHDYNLLMVLCMMTGILVIFCNLIGQIINEKIDPRIKANEVVETSEVTVS